MVLALLGEEAKSNLSLRVGGVLVFGQSGGLGRSFLQSQDRSMMGLRPNSAGKGVEASPSPPPVLAPSSLSQALPLRQGCQGWKITGGRTTEGERGGGGEGWGALPVATWPDFHLEEGSSRGLMSTCSSAWTSVVSDVMLAAGPAIMQLSGPHGGDLGRNTRSLKSSKRPSQVKGNGLTVMLKAGTLEN